MQKQDDSLMHRLLGSFNSAAAYYGTNMDSMMADVAIEILSIRDTTSMRDLTFFDKGKLLLADCTSEWSEEAKENVEACMFWWVFNEEIMENEVRYLVEKSKKP